MNINILCYSLFGIAGGQEVDRNFSESSKVSVMQCEADKATSNVSKQKSFD